MPKDINKKDKPIKLTQAQQRTIELGRNIWVTKEMKKFRSA